MFMASNCTLFGIIGLFGVELTLTEKRILPPKPQLRRTTELSLIAIFTTSISNRLTDISLDQLEILPAAACRCGLSTAMEG